MPSAAAPIAVLGAAGTGRSHRLADWVETVRRESGTPPQIVSGRTLAAAAPELRATLVADVVDAITAGNPIAVDDADHCPDDVMLRIIDQLRAHPTPLSLVGSDHHRNPLFDELIGLVADVGSVVHTELLDAPSTADLLDTLDVLTPAATDDGASRSARIHRVTRGSTILIAEAAAADWDGDLESIPTALAHAVARWTRRAGPHVSAAIQLASLGTPFDLVLHLLHTGRDPGDVEPELRASGCFDGDELIPVVAAVVAASLTTAERQRAAASVLTLHDRLPPTLRARLTRLANAAPGHTDQHTADALADAAAAFHLGDPDAIALVTNLAPDDTNAPLQFGADMRSMRWSSAGARVRRLADLESIRGVSQAFDGDVSPLDLEPGNRAAHGDPAGADAIHRAILEFAHGDLDTAIGTISRAVDDAVHAAAAGTSVNSAMVHTMSSVGFTAPGVGALLTLGAGDPRHAAGLVDLGITHDIGGPGEQRFHRLLRAIADMQIGDYLLALDAVRAGDEDWWPHRDRVLLAAIDAAIARRSGDMQRLRDGWARAAPLLARDTISWLYTDALVELLSAGARIGDRHRATTLRDRLTAQLRGLPTIGPGATWAMWCDLQLAVASDDWTAVIGSAPDTSRPDCAEGVDQSDRHGGRDRRSVARRSALAAWATIGRRAPDTALVRDAARQLTEAGDAWEASRLLGQAALDQADPGEARTLLEAARLLVAPPTGNEDRLIAAGLSEREAEVARLVVDGLTYKDIGAQLFISPKTVEHHVAKIRQRLDASSRAEMLGALRELL